MAEIVTIDKDAAREMLNMATMGVGLCRSILEHHAVPRYIVERDFAKWFPYMQRILGPAVFGKDWRGDGS